MIKLKVKHYFFAAVTLALVAMIFSSMVVGHKASAVKHHSVTASSFKNDPQERLLNSIATKGLDQTQRAVLVIAKQQYALHPTSFDATVLQYTDGGEEPWCADFISWVLMQANVQYQSSTDGWRIPGVDTLQEYYQGYNSYSDLTDNYTPRLGDVAFYTGVTPDGSSSSHVALILGYASGRIITIGGNEGAGAGTVQVRDDLFQSGAVGLSGVGKSNI